MPSRPIGFVYPDDPPTVTADVLENLLAGYQRQARVVLVDVWSVTHDASRDRFGGLIDLHAKHRVSGLQCVAAAFDDPGQWAGEIAPFLRTLRCSYPCVVVPAATRGELVARLGYEWNGSIPAVLVFDRDGYLAAELIGDVPFVKVQKVVDDVLAGRHEPIVPPERRGRGQIAARSRTLDLTAGKMVDRSSSQWASLDDVQEMAIAIAKRCEATIDWPNAKVAVLPFTVVRGADRAKTGKALADAVARILSTRHPQAVVPRGEADAILARHKLTPLGVEYDPTVLAEKANWTHIITGTLRAK